MRTLNILFLIGLMSCQGRCREEDAVRDVVPEGSRCYVDTSSHQSFCQSRIQDIECQVSGAFFHEAHCQVVGTHFSEKP